MTISDNANVQFGGTMIGNIDGSVGWLDLQSGSLLVTANLLLGPNPNATGYLNLTGGALNVPNGVLGVGNAGSLTTGGGHGVVTVANATLTAASIQLGSANGGSGELIVEAGGHVSATGGLTFNDVEVKQGGTLTVIYRATPFSFEDPNLHNRILGGYLRDGALKVTGGTVIAPEIVVGLANGIGTLNLSSGSVTATGNMLVGVNSSASGSVNITGGALDVSNGVLGVGNAGSLTTGNGHGSLSIANASLTAASIQLGSANGGSGDMTIDNGGDVTVLGGLTSNDVEVKQGGKLRVLYNPTPFSFEDANMHNRILAGYLHDGALNVTGGTVSAPEIVVGLANGHGALNMSSGSVTVTGNLLVGVDSSASGSVNITGGTVNVPNGVFGIGNGGSPTTGNGTGTVRISNATIVAANIQLGSASGGAGNLVIGDGVTIIVTNPTHTAAVTVSQAARW